MNDNFKPTNSFEIENSNGFYEKLKAEYDDFDGEHLNARFAINAAITPWHLTDWTSQEFFKTDSRFQNSKFQDSNGKTKTSFGIVKYQDFLKENCSELELMRKITNGSKHCKINKDNRTEISEGDFSPYEYDRNDYDVPRFVIISNDNEEIDFE